MVRGWNGDGILARIADQRIADAVLRAGVPVVDFRVRFATWRFPLWGRMRVRRP